MISNVGERIGSEYRIVVKWPKFGLVGFVGLGSVGLGWVGLFNATLSFQKEQSPVSHKIFSRKSEMSVRSGLRSYWRFPRR